MILFEENHNLKVIIWLVRLSPAFPSNLGMSGGSLVSIAGHVGSCNIGSLVSLVKSSMLRQAKYRICGGGGGLVPAVITEISSTQGGKNSTSSKQNWSHSWHKNNATTLQKRGPNYTK
jgi:hypothetical protein